MKTWCTFQILALFAIFGLAGFAVAQDRQGVDHFSEEKLKELVVSISKAAHPTGMKPALLKHTTRLKGDVLHVKMEIEYYGGVLRNRYTADVLLRARTPRANGDPLEVLGIDFVDNNNRIRPNQKSLEKLIKDLNRRFRVAAAK